jgi:hypothetical protein
MSAGHYLLIDKQSWAGKIQPVFISWFIDFAHLKLTHCPKFHLIKVVES